MAIKQKDGSWQCMFCDFKDPNPSKVNDHMYHEHDYVLLPILKSDLNKIIMFIFTNSNNRELISEDLYKKLKAYSKFTPKGAKDL